MKGKIDKNINIEEMILRHPDFGDLLTELIRLQNSHKTKKIVIKKRKYARNPENGRKV